MFILVETATGYALFNISESRIGSVEAINEMFDSSNSSPISEQIELVSFENLSEEVLATNADYKLEKLKKLLDSKFTDKSLELMVCDEKLGAIIKSEMGIECVHDEITVALTKGIHSRLNELLGEAKDASVDLEEAISPNQEQLKKIDAVIIEAVSLLDNLEKELHVFTERVMEWYGWHFPELKKILDDDILYIKTVSCLQNRSNAQNAPLNDFLTQDLATKVREYASFSMGTDITDEDMLHITNLAEQVKTMNEYRSSMLEYIKKKMQLIAPNLTNSVGELVGARLIAKSGGLLNLAKQNPNSKISERIAKSGNAPKYGLLYYYDTLNKKASKTPIQKRTIQDLPADLMLEIFIILFDGLSNDWQFTTLQNCSLVCKEWNDLLNWRNYSFENNLWKLILKTNSITLDHEDTPDVRKELCKYLIPKELTETIPNLEFDYFDFGNYQTFGEIHAFKMKKSFGFGILKRMIKQDTEIHALFKEFMSNANPDLYFQSISLNTDLVDRYELSMGDARDEYNGGRTFDEEKKDLESNCLFLQLTKYIRGENIELSDLNHLREFIKHECPIVAEYKDCVIGGVFSMAFLLITKYDSCVYFEYCAEV